MKATWEIDMRFENDRQSIEGNAGQDPWPVRLGRGIAALRTGRRWSRKKLALVLEVSYQRLGHWERGVSQPPIEKLIALGQVLEVSIEELLKAGESETSNPSPVP
jgi:transcriptional regulator with XRE-family HTH domain